MDDAARRNFMALADGLKEQRATNSAQDLRISMLESRLAQLAEGVSAAQQQIAMLLAQARGHGPTSRTRP